LPYRAGVSAPRRCAARRHRGVGSAQRPAGVARSGSVAIDPRTQRLTAHGEPVDAPPLDWVGVQGRDLPDGL